MTYGDSIWPMKILKICLEEQLLIEYYVIKHSRCQNLKYDGYQGGLASMAYKFFDKKSSCGAIKSEIILNQQLADKLHKLIIRNIQKRKVYPSFKDSILVAELADMQLLSKYNKRIYFLLCAFDICSKYAGIVPLKYEKGITITNAFQKVINESGCKPNKIWVDKGSKFCNSSMKS